jgi:hypothetical protein
MGADHTPTLGHEVGNGLDQPRSSRVGMDIKDKYLARVQCCPPKIASVRSKTHMVSLVSSTYRHSVYNSAVLTRVGIHIDGNQLILFIPCALHTESPNVNEILLPSYLDHIGRQTGVVSLR